DLHARTIGVEDAPDLDRRTVPAVVVEAQRFGAALALVVAGTRAGGAHRATVVLGLRVHFRLTVDLTGRGLEDPRAGLPRQLKHVAATIQAGPERVERVVLVMHRRGAAGKVEDPVHRS